VDVLDNLYTQSVLINQRHSSSLSLPYMSQSAHLNIIYGCDFDLHRR